MKKIATGLLLLFFSATFFQVQAQSIDAHDKLKAEINKMVDNVEKADTPDEKRDILNNSLDDLLTTFDKVSSMEQVPKADKEALADFSTSIQQKKDELNGKNGYDRVPDSELNEFAQFVQQDIEQADRVITISLTTALLVVLILLLL